jgi:hypothetical protein
MTPPPVPAPEPLSAPRTVGRPTGNYSALEMREFYGEDGKLLGLSTLYRWSDTGEIPSIKKGGKRLWPKALVNPQLLRDGIFVLKDGIVVRRAA